MYRKFLSIKALTEVRTVCQHKRDVNISTSIKFASLSFGTHFSFFRTRSKCHAGLYIHSCHGAIIFPLNKIVHSSQDE